MMLGVGAGLFATTGGALCGLTRGKPSNRFNASWRTPESASGSWVAPPASSHVPQPLSVTTIFGVDANVTVVSELTAGHPCAASDAVGNALMVAAKAWAHVASTVTVLLVTAWP